MVLKAAKNAIIIFLLLGIVCGVGYPALVTVIAQKAFPEQANGSIVYKDGKPVGSRLIGQEWTQPKYFWGRPSAIPGGANNAMTSTSSNDGPTSPWLINKVRDRVAAQRKANPDAKGPVPQDLATTSASGLDPDITPEDALWQVERVAKYWNSVDGAERLSTRREVHLPAVEDPTGESWGALLTLVTGAI